MKSTYISYLHANVKNVTILPSITVFSGTMIYRDMDELSFENTKDNKRIVSNVLTIHLG